MKEKLLFSDGQADVIVIGSGAGGGVIAKELAEAGLNVIVLEAGKHYRPLEDYTTQAQDFEVRASKTFSSDEPRRDSYTAPRDQPFIFSRVKGVGGSTLIYHAMSPRFHESDFRVYSEDGVADDWPISYADLEPYYTKVEYELGVSGPDGKDCNPFDPPRSQPYPTPAHEFNAASQAIRKGAERLGLHLVREPLAIPTRDWGGRPRCANAGTCTMGCRIAAKSSIDVTYIPKAERTRRVDLRAECLARKISVGPDGRARGVVYFDKQGREHEIVARAIVVAGNAVETARLLLLSKSSRFPDGLANSSGLVGKRFMEHLSVFAHGVFPERIDPWRGAPTGGILQDFYATRSTNGFARGWTTSVENEGQWPLATAQRIPGWGARHQAKMKEIFGHAAGVASDGEQLPSESNQVALDESVRDHHSLPVPHIVNRWGENDRAMIAAMAKSHAEILEASGARDIEVHPCVAGGSSHYLGTCRMGTNPKTSVVDRWCRTHDVPNLFIGDGSVFVTGAAVNPALTISALAARTADGMIEAFRRGEL